MLSAMLRVACKGLRVTSSERRQRQVCERVWYMSKTKAGLNLESVKSSPPHADTHLNSAFTVCAPLSGQDKGPGSTTVLPTPAPAEDTAAPLPCVRELSAAIVAACGPCAAMQVCDSFVISHCTGTVKSDSLSESGPCMG